MQGWVPTLVWEESGSLFWETENSCMGSWIASQSPWCPKLLPCHCQSSISGNYPCSLARCPENRWSSLCCFQRTSNPMTSYGPVNCHIMFSFRIILYVLHHLFPYFTGFQSGRCVPSETWSRGRVGKTLWWAIWWVMIQQFRSAQREKRGP